MSGWISYRQSHAALVTAILLGLCCFAVIIIQLTSNAENSAILSSTETSAGVLTNYSLPWVEASQRIKLSMHGMQSEVNPCKDFYKYACGDWSEYHPNPPGTGFHDVGMSADAKLFKTVSSALLDGNFARYGSMQQTLLKTISGVLKSCLNQKRDKEGRYLLTKFNSNTKILDWPLLTGSKYNEATGNPVVEGISASILYDFNVDTLFKVRSSIENIRNATLFVDPLQIPFGDYMAPILQENSSDAKSIRSGYKALIVNIAKLIATETNLQPDLRKLAACATDIIRFEQATVRIKNTLHANPKAKARTKIYKSIPQLQSDLRGFQWEPFIKPILPVFSSIVVRDVDEVKLIAKLWKSTSPTARHNYVAWRLILAYLPYMRGQYETLLNEFYGKIKGGRQTIPTRCAQFLFHYMHPEMHSIVEMLARQTKADESALLSLANSLRNSSAAILRTQLSKSTLRSLKLYGKSIYPLRAITLTPSQYNQFIYSDLKLSEIVASQFTAVVSKIRGECRKVEGNIGGMRTVCSETNLLAMDTLPKLQLTESHQIRLSLQLLTSPYYKPGMPEAVLFGTIGSLVGEYSTADAVEAMTLSGKLLGPKVDPKRASALLKIAASAPIAKESCSTSSGPRACLHGRSTGNIAANLRVLLGLEAAFEAYSSWGKSRNGIDARKSRLPGFHHLSMNQVFFLSYAQLYCGNYSLPYLKATILRDPKPPGFIRIQSLLAKYAPFQRSYGCH